MLAGVLFYIITFSWAGGIAEIGMVNWLLFMVAPLSLYFLIFGVLYGWINNCIGAWIIVAAPALWVALEYVRSNLFFLALPWNLLAHSQFENLPVLQIADVTGVYGISFLMVMVNQLFSRVPEIPIFRRFIASTNPDRHVGLTPWIFQVLYVATALVVALTYGWYRQSTPSDGQQVRVALVQANRLTKDNMPFKDQVAHLREYDRLTRLVAGEDPELIVWPASSLPASMKANRFVRHTIVKLARDTSTYLLVGGAGYSKLGTRNIKEMTFSNSEFLISPAGRLTGQYDKMRLLPFNEYVPLKESIKWPAMLATIGKDFKPGKKHTIFQVSAARFGTPICWENLFPDHFRQFVKAGANFMVCATNEGFYGLTAAPHQTLAINVFRAVENRVAIARAATTGVSAFIEPDGKIVERVQDSSGNDLFVSGFLVRDVPLSEKKTFYTKYGDVFAFVAIGITLISLIYSFLVSKSNVSSKHRR